MAWDNPDAAFSRWTGACLILAGLLTALINGGLTPLLPAEGVERSEIFFWRQTGSALVAVLLIFGAIGIHLRQRKRAGLFSTLAFAAACAGSALLLAQEWNQIFFVRDLAIRYPETMVALEAAEGLTLFDWGALLAVAAFTLGWIALAAATIVLGVFSRRPAILLIAGFFAVPFAAAALPMALAAMAGNLVLGAGFAWLGLDLLRSASSPSGA